MSGEGRALLVRQFRYPAGEELLEAPAGRLEAGEDPLEAAKRELCEETGCTAENWTGLGFIYQMCIRDRAMAFHISHDSPQPL